MIIKNTEEMHTILELEKRENIWRFNTLGDETWKKAIPKDRK